MSDYTYTMDNTSVIGCGCAACMGNSGNGYLNNSDDDIAYVDSEAPSTMGGKEEFGLYLTDGYWQDAYSQYGSQWANANYEGWNKNNLTFSIGNWYSANEKAGIRDAFTQWSDVTNLNFTEVGSNGDINFDTPNAGNNETGRAFASVGFSLSGGTASINGPVRVIIDYDSGGFGSNPTDLGNYALTTAIHEIGHAIGLGHSGWYNAGQGNPSYNNDGQWINDTRQYSLMSYWSASNSGANHLGENSSTPMLMDIYAIQTLYGLNMGTRSGNTVYGFNSNAGRDQFDFTINVEPVVAIWDGGGTDTIDVSGWAMTQMLNLNDGTFSNVGGGTGNLAIAYGAVIENATGGGGNDTIYGNEYANTILGNAGSDTIYGSAGSDALNGGIGTDTLNYSYDISDFLVTLVNSVTVTFEHIDDSWTDTAIAIENFIFNGAAYSFDDLEQFNTSMGTVTLRFVYEGITRFLGSTEAETRTLTADNLGYDGGSGDMYTLTRTNNSLTLNIDSASAPDHLTLWGSDGGNTINITGTHAGLRVFYFGNTDSDELTLAATITGDAYIEGGGGDDTITASSGTDIIYGQSGNDVIHGAGGADSLDGGDGDDTITAGQGNDYISGGSGEDSIYGNEGNDRIYAGEDDDYVEGGDGIDTIYGEAGADTIYGGNDRDIIYGGTGADRLYGGSGNDYIEGGGDGDTIQGGDGIDTIYGQDGGDNIFGGTGNDSLFGGNEDDTISGDDGSDYIEGGAGADTIYGNNGNDRILGGSENDYIAGGIGSDTLYGELGNDFIYGGANRDFIYCGEGDDRLYGETGDDYIEGGAGADQIYGDDGIDRIYAGIGNDYIEGGDGIDTLYGEDGNDTIYGGNDRDIIYGNAGNDTLSGDGGNDYIESGAGDDTINGGEGSDTIYGQDDNDIINGGNARDYLYGQNGNDTIHGGAGNDYIAGGTGDDTLYGDAGLNTLYGGSGTDSFVFEGETAFDSMDYIKDFSNGETINIADILNDFGYNSGSDDLGDWLTIHQDAYNSFVMVDRDGAGDGFGFSAIVVTERYNALVNNDIVTI